ncbi:MAG: hypothetical protein CSA81_09645 [Acidobacteria bacterium]|nr:MAG: hypothetical protein CSA81_09645 [Acidobacteriota bacterium]PIE89374.1 MAG: hypothetical protein CR997_11645 [Acidobacteriota bacterium]
MSLLTIQDNHRIPDLEKVLLSNQWRNITAYLHEDIYVRLNLRPLLNDRGRLSRSQLLYSVRKLFSRYEITKVQQDDFKSDTNYSKIEITARCKIYNKRTRTFSHGVFLFMFSFHNNRAILTHWSLTDFSP